MLMSVHQSLPTEFCGRPSKLVADVPGWLCLVGLVAFRRVLTECWQLAFASFEGRMAFG